MVGPSLTDEDRDVASKRLKLGFVGLVGISGALIAVQGGGSEAVIAAGFAAGLVVGAVLLWFLLRWWAEFLPAPRNGR
ncbi:hypothetical protein [Halobellus salinisoli]|uniref:hypothetical protein n=1 Tax=Halobellus salinisoli TaxID=3108500 RepID=UPI0030090492